MANYSVVDANGLIVNRVVIANAGDWTPPAGYSLVAESGSGYAIGGNYSAGVYTAPLQPDPPQPSAAQIAEANRQQTFRSDNQRAAMLTRLQTATGPQIDAYVSANITNLAQAQAAIGIILKLIALDSRS